MPPTATSEQIKAYQRRIEKNEIKPDELPACPLCAVESAYFKLHAYRERRFLVIVKLIIETVFTCLVRFKCPGCGKTFTYYPDFALPYKRYTQQSITGFSAKYVDSDNMTYRKSVEFDGGVPEYPDSLDALCPSTVHRWITTTGQMPRTCRTALGLMLQENPTSSICRDLARLVVPGRKYKTERRRKQLLACQKLLVVEAFFQDAFENSIFTKLATACGLG